MQQGRKYRQEYKYEAVQLVLQSELPISQIATNLGINNTMLRRWVKEHAEPNKSAFTGHGTARDQELAVLKQELKHVKKERDFLREAATYFARYPSEVSND